MSFSQSTFICEPFLEMNVCGNSQLLSLSDQKINEWCILDALLVQVFPSPRAKVFISSSVCSSSGKDMFLSEPSPLIAFSCHWVTECSCWIWLKLDLLKLLLIVRWICQNWYMDFSKLLHGFVKNCKWIYQNWQMNVSKLLHGFCQSCRMDY